ncbi:PucR family transcriptional regulator [Umezawaea tangerina]|uniref:DNA-binding PucR family transcriptional regulator n=1 Tax=Umezawaea tangerina TaxID=84725 RepID=A0A2T0SK26_9PSEU|nr:PucR family transcriptional regulator [Umezawaea tangerina]PRY33768.1 DNA-binding PucR family transcriptional regulator [Umezawaea tangerina]
MVLRTVPLAALVGRDDLGLTVLVGEDDLDRPVCWAHVSELVDPVPYLLGQELLLTAGVTYPEDVDAYVAGLVGRGVSALGFGVTPVHNAVPRELVDACRAHGLPLVAVPPGTPFMAVSQAVGAALAEAQNAELRLLADSQRAMTRAAVRPAPVEGTLAALVDALGCWALLLDADNGVLARAGEAPGPTTDLVRLADRVREGSGPRSAGTTLDGDQLVLNPVERVGRRPSVLVLGRPRSFSVADRAVVAVALALLALLRPDPDPTARLAARLVFGGDPAPLLEGLLGGTSFQVVAGADGEGYERLADVLGTPLVDVADDGFRAVVVSGTAIDPDLVVGVSAPAPPAELPAAHREAAALLRRARATGRTALAVEGSGVTGLVDPAQARRFACGLLAPLADHRSPSAVELVETARAWLAQHGNWDRSAAALGVHRNSVRHRMGHVERALGLDLTSAQDRTDLWCAISWLPPEWPATTAG